MVLDEAEGCDYDRGHCADLDSYVVEGRSADLESVGPYFEAAN